MEAVTHEDVRRYIKTKKMAWSFNTIVSERARLQANLDLVNMEPMRAFEAGKTRMKDYTLKTFFIRVSSLYTFLGHKNNPWEQFMRDYAQLFKYAYKPEELAITYEEAARRVQSMEMPEYRELAAAMLRTGLRISELFSYDGSGFVTGKGGKRRKVYMQGLPAVSKGLYAGQLRAQLKRVGLKPHTLRKLAATKLAASGMAERDLMKVFGWSSMETAAKYLQPKNDRELERFIEGVLA